MLATKAALSILQMQRRVASEDIKTLQRTKERGMADPEEFLRALEAGEIKQKGNVFMGIVPDDHEDEDEDVDGDSEQETKDTKDGRAWEKLPKPQDVVKMPHINWDQYAIVGESLEKLHRDQLKNPPEGEVKVLGSDGGLSGKVFADALGTTAPGREKMEKMGTRKGGKR